MSSHNNHDTLSNPAAGRGTMIIAWVLATALALTQARCGSGPATGPVGTAGAGVEQAGTDPARPQALQPLSLGLRVSATQGKLEGQTPADGWTGLRAGQSISGLTQLRAVGRGAMLTLRGEQDAVHGKLWIRGGSRLRLGQTPAGAVRLALLQGEARVSLFHATRPVVQVDHASGPMDVSGQDVLLVRRSVRGALMMSTTARRPHLAEWTLRLHGVEAPAGVGSMESRDSRGNRAALELRRVWVKAWRAGDVAETHVEHLFHNDSGERLEGTFRFPVPEGASLLGLAMEINGELMEGELVERHKARRTYEAIVDSMQDPALLEWEQGNMFKLRVFPIEPHKDKRIVIRYVAPLRSGAAGPQYAYATAAPAMQRSIPEFWLDFDGQAVARERDHTPGKELVVHLRKERAAGLARKPQGGVIALGEARNDGTYTALRLQADSLLKPASRKGTPPRDLLLVLDSSRSSLESRGLALQAAKALLGDLRPGQDRFLVVAADVAARDHAPRFVAATLGAVRRGMKFLRGVEPDGATDLGLALRHAALHARANARPGRQVQLVYIGDGTATWGETDPAALRALCSSVLGELPLHVMILGRGPDADLLRGLAARQGGRVAQPKELLGVRRFALVLRHAAVTPRLRDAMVTAGEQDQVFPRHPVTLFSGDTHTVLVRTPPGHKPPTSVVLRGVLRGKAVERRLRVAATVPTRHVAHRWARRYLAHMQAAGKPREEVVQHSLSYGVMSRHTSFLVLESEEAYKRHKIARRTKQQLQQALAAKAGPKVTGGDLESLGQRRASMSPDHMQPGDPEIRIPAPRDARSVVVVFPFGESKVARYEEALDAWTVRFLIAKETADGTYQVTVRITHPDGRVELLPLSYVVDTRGPMVRVSVRALRQRGKRVYRITASQIISKLELAHELRRWEIAGTPVDTNNPRQMRRQVELVKDAHRVEVRTPDGQAVRLWPAAAGKFVGTWRPRRPTSGPQQLTVIAVDRAHNRKEHQLTLDPTTGKVTQQVSK